MLCADDFTGLVSILHRKTVIRGAWQATAIASDGGLDPWFADPDEHHVNTLDSDLSERSRWVRVAPRRVPGWAVPHPPRGSGGRADTVGSPIPGSALRGG